LRKHETIKKTDVNPVKRHARQSIRFYAYNFSKTQHLVTAEQP